MIGIGLLACAEARAGDDAKDVAWRFYRSYDSLRQSAGLTGIPDADQLQRLAPFLTLELQALFFAALREQQRCIRQFPGNKPPWIEGDIFSSSFEGFTSFATMKSRTAKEGREVPVRFQHGDGKARAEWSDTLMLRPERGHWRVDDVAYRGNFAFSSGFGTSLKSSLRRIPAC